METGDIMFDERVILIKGDSSKWYEQAIFIIKKNAPQGKMPVDFVMEAERIINNYMSGKGKATLPKQPEPLKQQAINPQTERPKKVKRKNTFDIVLNTLLLVGLMALMGIFLWSTM